MLGRAYRSLLHAGAVAAALLLGVLALLVTGDVVARNLGLGTLPWIIEVSEYSLPLATFLVAPWLLHRNEHVRLDVLLTSVPAAPRARAGPAADLVGWRVCVVFVWYGDPGSSRIRAAIGAMVYQGAGVPRVVAVRTGPGVFRVARGGVSAMDFFLTPSPSEGERSSTVIPAPSREGRGGCGDLVRHRAAAVRLPGGRAR